MLNSGESFRVKNGSHEFDLIQPPMETIFFLGEAELYRLLAIKKDAVNFQEKMIGHTFNTSGLQTGVTPVDFGVIGLLPIAVTKKPGKLTILGDETGAFASGMHIGHKVTEIMK